MLTEDQQKYLLTIPEQKLVTIYPFTFELEATANELMLAAQTAVPTLEVRHMGAAALGLSGQGDIDIYVLCDPKDFATHLSELSKVFGPPIRERETSITWAFEKNGFPVELYLTDPTSEAMQEQTTMFELLRDNTEVRHEYEALKESLNGHSFRDYQAAKYEFYNRALGITDHRDDR